MANPWRLLMCIRRSLTKCETHYPLLYSSLKAWQRDGSLLFVPGEHGELQGVTTQTTASPCHLPLALWQVPSTSEKPHSIKKRKCQPRCSQAFCDEIAAVAGKQTSWPAGSFPDLRPCRTQNSSSSNQLSINQCSHTHTKPTYLQKRVSNPILNV